MVRVSDSTWFDAWPHVIVTSVGAPHELTKMAAMEPPVYPVDENATPIESTGGPVGQFAYSCRMMSRWPQHSVGLASEQAALVVPDVPPQPSLYIQ